jgi:hypothetical protein
MFGRSRVESFNITNLLDAFVCLVMYTPARIFINFAVRQTHRLNLTRSSFVVKAELIINESNSSVTGAWELSWPHFTGIQLFILCMYQDWVTF